MKKLLALVLALVMTLSLAAVSSNAAFDDADSIEYKEAVEVLNAIAVLTGDGTGNFNPNGVLNREQAAKIVAYVLLGKEVADKVPGTAKFSDVKATDWAAGYIAYCAANGIIAGDGTGKFNPKAELTGAAFAKMLLVAIGAEGTFTGADWATNVAIAVEEYKLNAGLESIVDLASTKLTREQAAQMALNALLYSKSGSGWKVTLDGVTFTTNSAQEAMMYKILEATVTPVGAQDSLLSKTFGVTKNELGVDTFGRPAVEYKKGDKTLVLVANEASFTYTGKAFTAKLFNKGNDLYGYKADEAKVLINNADSTLAEAYGVAGATVEVYASNKVISKIIVTLPSFYEVTKVETKKDVTTVTLNGTDKISSKDNKDAYALVEDYAKGDVFMGVKVGGELVWIDDEIDSVDGKITAKATSYVRIDGTKYEWANGFEAATIKENGLEGTFYLYNDLIVGFKKAAAATATTTIDDVFYAVKGYSKTESGEYGGTVTTNYQQIVNLDGTVESIVVDKAYDKGLYTIEKTDKGVNTLKAWEGDKTYKLDEIAVGTTIKGSKLAGKSYTVRLNAETEYVVSNGKELADLKVTTATGSLNAVVKGGEAIVIGTVSGSNLTAAYVLVPNTEAAAVEGTLVYVAKATGEEIVVDKKDCKTYVAYDMTGAEVELTVLAETTVTKGFYTYTTKNDVDTVKAYSTVLAKADGTGILADKKIVKSDFYGTLLTIDSIADIETADASVIDMSDNDIADLDDVIDALETNNVTVTLYAKDGIKLIIVTAVDAIEE